MTGFITDSETAAAVSAAVSHACDVRGLPRYIFANFLPVYSGPHAGMMFLGMCDADLQTVLHRGHTLSDFPEFHQLVALLGGLDARVEISPADLIAPAGEI